MRSRPAALAEQVLAILVRDTARTDAELAAELGTTPTELSPVIGLLYRQRRADRCAGYLVATPPICLPATCQEDTMSLPTPPATCRTALLDAALACAARGWPVFPLRPHGKTPAFPDHTADRCAGTDPWCQGGHQGWEPRATTDPGRLTRGWARTAYNIGIATGPAALVVLDLDKPKPGEVPPPQWALPGVTDGADVLATLCERHGQPYPAATFTVRTRRGGLHLYFTAPPGTWLGNTTGRSGHALGWLIDTRAHGGYVVAPGSFVDLPDGTGPYKVTNDHAPATLPGWLAALLTPAGPAPHRVECLTPPGTVADLPTYADAALRGEVERVVHSPDHGHNWALNKAAFNLGRRIAAGVLDRDLAEQALQAAGQTAHTDETPARIQAVIRAGIDAGIRKVTGTAA